MKYIIFTIYLISIFYCYPAEALSADNLLSEHLAISDTTTIKNFEVIDYRVIKLEQFLRKYNSPLAEYSEQFIISADKYNIDWRLVPAITGVESTFGKRIPLNSYNAYGWNNGNYSFESWEKSIDHVTKTIRLKYVNDGLDNIDKIAKRYCPPNPQWAWKVKYFMYKIDPYPMDYNLIK